MSLKLIKFNNGDGDGGRDGDGNGDGSGNKELMWKILLHIY